METNNETNNKDKVYIKKLEKTIEQYQNRELEKNGNISLKYNKILNILSVNTTNSGEEKCLYEIYTTEGIDRTIELKRLLEELNYDVSAPDLSRKKEKILSARNKLKFSIVYFKDKNKILFYILLPFLGPWLLAKNFYDMILAILCNSALIFAIVYTYNTLILQ